MDAFYPYLANVFLLRNFFFIYKIKDKIANGCWKSSRPSCIDVNAPLVIYGFLLAMSE